MDHHEQPKESFFEELDGPVLVRIGNWLVESLDLSELENEQVLLLYLIFSRCVDELFRLFPEVLGPFLLRQLGRWITDEDD